MAYTLLCSRRHLTTWLFLLQRECVATHVQPFQRCYQTCNVVAVKVVRGDGGRTVEPSLSNTPGSGGFND